MRYVLVLSLAGAALAQCPTKPDGDSAQQRGVSLVLPEGCVAPYTGRLYDDPMLLKVRENFAAAKVYVEEAERQRDAARALLATCRNNAAHELDACAEPTPVLRPLPPRRGWVWAGAGAFVSVAPLGACEFVDCGPAYAAWAAAGVNALAIVALAWLLD